MKALTIILLLLPSITIAQKKNDSTVKTLLSKHEIGIQTGIFAELGNQQPLSNIGATYSITYLHNFKKTQLGVVIEGGYSLNNILQLAPTIVYNNLVKNGSSYLYYGAATGYYWARDNNKLDRYSKRDGYTFGLQIGYVVPLSKSFSLNTEVAARSIQVWYNKEEYVPSYITFERVVAGHYTTVRAKDFYFKTPITIGLRYKF